MAGKISISCPACAAKLNLPDSSKLGKKIKCPKCGDIFVAEADDGDDLFEDEDEDATPSSRKRGGGSKDSAKGGKRGGGKGKSSSAGSSLPLIIGGVVAVLALAGGGLYFSGIFDSKPLPPPVQEFPPGYVAPIYPGGAAPGGAAPAQAHQNPTQQAHQALAASPTAMTPNPASAHSPAAHNAPSTTAPTTTPQAMGAITPTEKILGLRWMLPDTDMIIHIKPAEIWQAPLLKEPLSNPVVTKGLEDLKNKTGMHPTDVESITMGFVDMAGLIQKAAAQMPMGPGMSGPPGRPGMPPMAGRPPIPKVNPEDIHYVTVIKTKKPFDSNVLKSGGLLAGVEIRNGKTFFWIRNEPTEPPSAGWMVDDSTMVVTTKNDLDAVVLRGETNAPRKDFTSLDPVPQLLIAGVIPAKKEAATAESPTTPPPGLMPVPDIAKANEEYAVQLASLGVSIKGGFDVQISTLSGTDEGAKKLKAEIEKQVGQLRPMFDGYKKTAPPLLAELGEMLLANLKIEEANQIVKVSTGAPDSAKEKLEQLPSLIMMMAMMGGMSGPPGSFGKNPNSIFSMGNDAGLLSAETDPIMPSSVEGLPDGLSLTAKTAWSAKPIAAGNPAATDNSPTTLEIFLDVTGDGLDKICAASGVTSKSVKLEGGTALKRSKLTLAGGVDAQKTFIPFDLETGVPVEHPAETLRVRLTVDVPANKGTAIELLEGSFKILIAENSLDLSVEDVPQTAKQPLKGADFKAGGVKLIRGPKEAIPETLKLECGKDHFLSRARGNPGDILSITEVEKGNTIQRIYAKQPVGRFPDDFQLEFKLYSELKELTVTFRFENLPLPSPDAIPQQLPLQPSPR